MPSRPRPLRHRLLGGFLALQATVTFSLSPALVPLPAWAREGGAPEPDPLEQARTHLREADYDEAVALLEAHLVDSAGEPAVLEETYVLLVNTYVLLSNDFRSRGDDVTASLYMDRAEETVLACLQHPGLSHVRVEADENTPPETVALFRSTRARIFGSLRITALEPPDAVVKLDGHVLPVPEHAELPGMDSVPVGDHELLVEAEGYEPLRETITVRASTDHAREVALDSRRSFMWYASRGAVVLGVVGIAFLAGGGGGEPGTEEPLPGPPLPPTGP